MLLVWVSGREQSLADVMYVSSTAVILFVGVTVHRTLSHFHLITLRRVLGRHVPPTSVRLQSSMAPTVPCSVTAFSKEAYT